MIRGMYKNKNIILSIDSSKTNTAIAVWSRTFQLLDVFEFDGSRDRDIFPLIKEHRDTLKIIFEGANVIRGGIEDLITKKSEGSKHHHSRYVITAVFMSLICYFQDNHDITLEVIPNQTWKHVILPTELNRRSVYKGSVEYVSNKYPRFFTGGKDDDACDAICIGEYMKVRTGMTADADVVDIPDAEEILLHPCKYRLCSEHQKIKAEVGVRFQYNADLTLDANARAIANRIELGQIGYTLIPLSAVTIEDIYRCAFGKFEEHTSMFTLIVKRLESGKGE